MPFAATCTLPRSQYNALESIYIQSDGENWIVPSDQTKWTFPSSVNAPCIDHWAGITCSCSPHKNQYGIVALSLSDYNMHRFISSSIGNLTDLQILDLSRNRLRGTLPPEIGQLSALSNFTVSFNQLTGSIPAEIGQLLSLQRLNIYFNFFKGSIPSEIGQLSSLEVMDLSGNELSGSIPAQIGQLSSLSSLAIDTNQLTGTIPNEIGHLSKLQYLDLNLNHLRGSIPPEIGQLSAFQYLDLNSNLLTGSIPAEIGQLSLLRFFSLYSNQLVGSIPSELYQLSSLRTLDTGVNQLTGSIPTVISQLSSLQYLGLYFNLLTGSIPSEIGQLLSLRILYLDSNQFVGPIPSIISQLSLLEYLGCAENHLTGSFLSEIGQLSLLEDLYLFSNQLTGSIPSEIGQLSLLQNVDLNSNLLHGSIPTEICQLSWLQFLGLYINFLTGSIPSEIGQLSSLDYLDLDFNQLMGSIPPEISQLSLLYYLDLYSNHLTGSIPSEIGQLSLLQDLYLYSNHLSGSIPLSVCDMSLLRFLYLYDNAITSSIPECFGQLSLLISLALQSNHMSSIIPASLSNISSLVGIFLNDNHLTGTLPYSIGSIQSLGQLSLSNNQFSGSIFPAISTAKLTTLNIANNLFTGSITENIFLSSLLSALVASGNCLHGSIPETVCNVNDKSMIVFDFSNSGGNELCPDNQRIQSHRPPLVHGTFSKLGLSGTIPSCLLTSSSMTALRLSGNRLHGGIASSIPSSSTIKLVNLTLAYNSLTGSIPDWIQQHSFQELDLSNNRLDGTLSSDFMVSAYQTALGLAVNRLSGDLPRRIVEVSSNMSSLNVLSGNIFACDNEKLPSQDPSADSYSCGSYELYVSSYTWLGFVGSFILIGIIVRLVAHRCQAILSRYECYQLLISWSAAISQLFDKSVNNKDTNHSQVWISRIQQLPETVTFLVLIHFQPKVAFCVGVFLVCIALPTYIGLHPVSSIVTYDYGYVISMAYLHDIQPVIFIGTLLLILFVIAIYVIRSFLAFLNSIHTSLQGRAASVSIPSWQNNPYAWRQYLIFLALNMINFVVVMTVNIAYVNTLINSTSYSRVELLFIQTSVGFFKVVWNSYYVSWSCDWLASFSSHQGSMRSRYLMSIMNYIVAPVISTIVYSKSCFYFVFNSAEEVSSSLSLILFELGHCGFDECLISFPISIDSTSFSSFDYSYACGQALIVAYTPVLISSYLFSGLFRPSSIVLAFDNPISRFIHKIRNYRKIIPSPYRPKRRVKGRDIAVRLMVHSTVLFTFGLAAPILVIPIVFSVITDCSTYRLLVGKTLYENDIEVMEAGPNQKISINPIVQPSGNGVSIDTSIQISSSNHLNKYRNNKISIKADLLTMEHLDMASSYQAIDACFHLMIVFVMLFWALLFFDMIADVYGVINGIITMTCFAVLPALLLIAMDKSNLILRMMSQIGLSHVIDRYLANKLGLDMSRWKSIISSISPGADDHPDPSSVASSHDVEMMVSSRMHSNDQFIAEDHQVNHDH
jgi:Leucine-rich repeat (LRR) protein